MQGSKGSTLPCSCSISKRFREEPQCPICSSSSNASWFLAWGCLRFHLSHWVCVPLLLRTPHCLKAKTFLLTACVGTALDFLLTENRGFWINSVSNDRVVLSFHQRTALDCEKCGLWQWRQAGHQLLPRQVISNRFLWEVVTQILFSLDSEMPHISKDYFGITCTECDLWRSIPKNSSARDEQMLHLLVN